MYQYLNRNTHQRFVDDCTVRAISLAENRTWNQTYDRLSDMARSRGMMFNSVEFIEDYLDYNPKSNNQSTPSTNLIETSIFNDEDLKEIINYLHHEKDVFVYRKLLSFLFQKIGISLDNISKIIGISEETLL